MKTHGNIEKSNTITVHHARQCHYEKTTPERKKSEQNDVRLTTRKEEIDVTPTTSETGIILTGH